MFLSKKSALAGSAYIEELDMSNGAWAGTERCKVLKDIKEDVQSIKSMGSEEKNTVVSSINWLLDRYKCGN